MIIAFCGESGVGKDTAGAHLIKEYQFQRRAFADPLKKAVAALFDIPFWEVDKFKLDETVHVAVGYKTEGPGTMYYPGGSKTAIELEKPSNVPSYMWSPISEHNFREMLQRFGTEMGRDVFGQDFWVDQTLPVEGYYAGAKIVFTDVRFQNEIDRIHYIGGTVCRIKNPRHLVNKDPHSSEAVDLLRNIDYEIMNDTSLDDFIEEVDLMLNRIIELQL